jgi:hypothetical protein
MTDLREALAPLRGELPTDAEISAALRAATAPRRRRRWRLAAGLAAATAVAGVLFAALPGTGTSPLPATATGLLRAAAASAAEAQPEPFSGYRYTEVREHWHWPALGDRPVEEVEQTVENWVDRRWKGRSISQQGRVIQGDAKTRESYFVTAHDGPYVYGDGPLADLDIAALPTEPRALRDALVARYKAVNWAPGLPTPQQVHYDIVRQILTLLGTANTTPELRSGLWGALALADGVRKADDVGGASAVRIPTGYAEGNFTVVFNVDTSEMLSWSEVGSGTGTPDQTHTFVRAAHVSSIGDRPSP